MNLGSIMLYLFINFFIIVIFFLLNLHMFTQKGELYVNCGNYIILG